jgi:hypothetical protein
VLWGLKMGIRLVSDTIYGSYQRGDESEKLNQNVRLRHDSRSLAREASASGLVVVGNSSLI